MSLLLVDPNDPFRYLEVRGALVDAVPDTDGTYCVHLRHCYDKPDQQPPADSPDRVVLVMRTEKKKTVRR